MTAVMDARDATTSRQLNNAAERIAENYTALAIDLGLVVVTAGTVRGAQGAFRGFRGARGGHSLSIGETPAGASTSAPIPRRFGMLPDGVPPGEGARFPNTTPSTRPGWRSEPTTPARPRNNDALNSRRNGESVADELGMQSRDGGARRVPPTQAAPITEVFGHGSRTPTASELIDWALLQGWTQRPGPGPRTFVDSAGRVRLKIKDGVSRTGIHPDSQVPHVEYFDAAGQRVDPYTGLPTTRHSVGNHRRIVFDIPAN